MAAKDPQLKTRIAFDGEAEYKRVAAEIKDNVYTMGLELRKVTAEFADNAKSVEALTARQDVLKRQYDEQQRKVTETAAVLAKLEAQENRNEVAEQNYKNELLKAQIALTRAGNELKAVEKDLAGIEQASGAAAKAQEDYTKTCANINGSLKLLASELRVIDARYGENRDSAAALSEKQEVLTKQYAEQTAQVKASEKALAQLESQDGASTEAVNELKIALNNSRAEMYKTGNELKAVEKDLNAAGNEADDFKKEVKDAAEETEKAGNKFSAAAKAVGAVGSAFGKAMLTIGAAAAAAGAAMVGFAVSGSNAADELLTESAITRQTVEDLQKYAYAARFVDVEMSTLTGTMTKNIKAMNDARDGTGEAAEVYAQLGISVTEADGSLRDSNDVYWETVDALRNVQNATERDALAMSVLGKSATDLNSLINAGSEAFKAYGDEAEAMGIIMGEEQVNQLGNFNDTLERLTASLGGLKNAASMIALPFLNVLAGEGTAILSEFSKGIQAAGGDVSKMGDIIGKTLGDIVGLIASKLPELIKMGTDMIKAVVQGIAENAGLLAEAALSIVNTLVESIDELLPVILDCAMRMLEGLAQGLAQSLPVLIPAVIEIILTLVQTIAENIPLIIDCALMIIEGLIDGILNALPILIEMLPTIIITIVDGIIKGIPKILAAAGRIIQALIQGLIDNIPALIASIPYIIMGIVNGLASGIPEILASAANIIQNLIFGLIGSIPELVAAIPQIISGIVDSFASGENNFFEIGVNILKGVWNGMLSMFENLWNNIKGLFGKIIDGIKGLLGIHSPSTVFAGIGSDMAAGIGAGFEEEMKEVTAGIKNAIPTEFDTDTDIKLIAAAAVSAPRAKVAEEAPGTVADAKAGGGNVYVTQNIYTPQYNYAEQQRAAAQQFRQFARSLA
jgi:phage-related protein